MLRVEAQIMSTGKAADITVNMMEATEDARMDVSEWRKAPEITAAS